MCGMMPYNTLCDVQITRWLYGFITICIKRRQIDVEILNELTIIICPTVKPTIAPVIIIKKASMS